MWNLKKTKPKNPKWIKTKNLLDTQIIAWKLPQGKGVNTCEAGDYCRGYQCWSIKLKTRNLEKEKKKEKEKLLPFPALWEKSAAPTLPKATSQNQDKSLTTSPKTTQNKVHRTNPQSLFWEAKAGWCFEVCHFASFQGLHVAGAQRAAAWSPLPVSVTYAKGHLCKIRIPAAIVKPSYAFLHECCMHRLSDSLQQPVE